MVQILLTIKKPKQEFFLMYTLKTGQDHSVSDWLRPTRILDYLNDLY